MTSQELLEAYVDDVVRRLDRKRRNDVGVELRALLHDELQGLAETAGHPADISMTMDLLRRFGRPEDVAVRYRAPGFPIIDASETATFVKLTAIGMGLVWIGGLVATYRHGGGAERLTHWWMTFGLGAFWWPGFLVVCWGLASWVRRRFPDANEWTPRTIDRDRINRPLWILAVACATLGTIWLTSPAQYVEDITGGRLAQEFYRSLVYDDTFRQVRLPILLTLLVIQLGLYAGIVAQGRWRVVTRRLDMALGAAITALLVWSIAAGRIFVSDASNGVTRAAIALIVLIAVGDLAAKVYRELARVRVPAGLA